MRHFYSASTLAFITFAHSVLGQDCPTGYGRTVKWISCSTADNPRLQCATLDVPLDYSAPSTGGTLRIPLVRQPARDDLENVVVLNKTIIYNPGGPGVSGIDSLATGGGTEIQGIVGQGYHVVSFDPRGIGLSKPFDNGVNNYNCPTVANPPGGPFVSDQELQDALDGYTSQGNLCAQSDYSSKGQLVGTAYVARDVVAIANALQEDGFVRYYGYSYGTLLGATLSAMFPQRLDRVVLDGNINPSDYYFGLGAESVADVDKGVEKFFIECLAAGKPLCPLVVDGENAKQLQDRFDRYLSTLYASDKNAWFTAKSDMFEALRGPYGWPDYAKKLADSYAKANIAKRQASAPFDPQTAEAAAKAQPNSLSAVTCGDWQLSPTANVDDFKSWLALYNKTSVYSGDTSLITILYQCSRWTVRAKERFAGPYTGVSTRRPILFVQTMYDPVTPLISARNSSAGFLGSGVLRSSGTGHCSSAHPSTLLNKAIGEYFASGLIPDTSKVFDPNNLAFQVKNPPKTGDASNPSTQKRSFIYPAELMTADLEVSSRKSWDVLKRQAEDLPVGCIQVDSTTSTSSTTASSTTSVSTTTTGSTSSTASTATTTTSDATSGTVTPSISTSSSTTNAADFTSTTSVSIPTTTGLSATTSTSTTTVSRSSTSSTGSTATTTSSLVSVTSSSATTTTGTISSSNSVSSSTIASTSSIIISVSTSKSGPLTTTPGSTNTVSGSLGTTASGSITFAIGGTTSSTSATTTTGSTTATNSDTTTSSRSRTGTLSTLTPSTSPSTWTSGSRGSTPSGSTTSLMTFTTPTSLTTSSASNGPSIITTRSSTSDTGSFSFATSTNTWSSSRSYTTSASTSMSTKLYGSGNNPAGVNSQWLQWSTSTRTTTSVTQDSSWSQWTSATTTSKTTISKDPSWDPWSSQSTAAITSVVTKYSTKVQTMTSCPQDVKDCPYGSVVTSTIPYTMTTSIPTTTVVVTSIIDVCSTGLTTKVITVTATCDAGCTRKPTGVPSGYTTTAVWCSACATPSLVAVTSSITNRDKPSSTGTNSGSNNGGWTNGGPSGGGPGNDGPNNVGSINNGEPNTISPSNGVSNNGGSGNSSSNNSGSSGSNSNNDSTWSAWPKTSTASVDSPAKPDATQSSKPSVTSNTASKSSSPDVSSTGTGKAMSPTQSGSNGNDPSSSWSAWTGGDPTGSSLVAQYTGGADGKMVHFGCLALTFFVGFFVM